MVDRVRDKVALVIGGGQTPGETIGNGRATAIALAREGARVMVADRVLESAEETAATIRAEGGEAHAWQTDIVHEDEVREAVGECVRRLGRIDLLHNNVGASLALGDATATELTVEAFDRIFEVNLRGMWLTCKHALPLMREQRSGSIVNISSMAARSNYPYVGYKTTKIAVIGLTENLAGQNAQYGIRVNAILPGLMNTPMAIEARVAAGGNRADVIAERDRQVPLGRKMGTAWDVAYAALFLHSDEARFITGVSLPVDGGTGVGWRG
jgi:NAD(P)-dependent dehydrogenase (short-subunit alcohol dehydrogenase family)